jgi:hypothetical protein
MKMSCPSSQLHIPNFWIEYFTYVKVLTPSQRNIQAVMKTWLENESTIAKHGMMPIIRNSCPILPPNFFSTNYAFVSFVYICLLCTRSNDVSELDGP